MTAIRMTLLWFSAIIMIGIWLTGFDKVHWLLYVPPGFLLFAAVTGICPGLIIWSKLGFANESLSCSIPSNKSKQ